MSLRDKRLSVEQIIELHDKCFGASGIRDIGALESAVFAPYIVPMDLGVEEKAASLGYRLVKNHAFIDGNKRIAAHAMMIQLGANSVKLYYDPHELADMFMALAKGEKDDKDLLVWIQRHKRNPILRNAVKCKHCGDIIESHDVHEFRTCSCGACSVDGGHAYLKRSFQTHPDLDYEELSEYETA